MGLPSALSVVQFLIILPLLWWRSDRRVERWSIDAKFQNHANSYAVVGLLLILYVVPLLLVFNVSLKSFNEYLLNPIGIVQNMEWGNIHASMV